MPTTTAIAAFGTLVISALPFAAVGLIEKDITPGSMNSTITTVTQVPGSPAPLAADAPDSSLEFIGGPEGTGMFAVGTRPRDGLATIPVGRYEVKVAPNAERGNWMLCDTALCGPTFEDNATVVGEAIPPYSSTIYIGAKSRTLWVDNLILSPVEPGPPVDPASAS